MPNSTIYLAILSALKDSHATPSADKVKKINRMIFAYMGPTASDEVRLSICTERDHDGCTLFLSACDLLGNLSSSLNTHDEFVNGIRDQDDEVDGKIKQVLCELAGSCNMLVDEEKVCKLAITSSGNVPLHHAAYSGNRTAVKWLLVKDSSHIPPRLDSVNILNKGGDTPLHFAVSSSRPTLQIVKWVKGDNSGGDR